MSCVCKQAVNLEVKDLEAEYVGVPGLCISIFFPVGYLLHPSSTKVLGKKLTLS